MAIKRDKICRSFTFILATSLFFGSFSSAYLPLKSSEAGRSESASAAAISGGYGNFPEANAVNYGLSSAAPPVQVTYGSINSASGGKYSAPVVAYGSNQQPAKPAKPIQTPPATSYGASPNENVKGGEEKAAAVPPTSYAAYNTITQDVNEQQQQKPEQPNKPLPSSYGSTNYGGASESQQVSEGAQQKPKVVAPATSYSSYGGRSSENQQVSEGAEQKLKPAPAPAPTSYSSYGSATENQQVSYQAEQKPKTSPTSYGGAAENQQVSYGAEVKPKPPTSYSSYGGVSDSQQVSQGAEQKPKPLPPTSYAAYSGAESSAVGYGGLDREQPVTTKAVPPASYGSNYGSVSNSENVQQKPYAAPQPPVASYGSYAPAGEVKNEQQYKGIPSIPSMPPTPAAPIASGYGNYGAAEVKGYKSPSKEVKATMATQKPTQKPVVPPSSYGQYGSIDVNYEPKTAEVPAGNYGAVPQYTAEKTPSAASATNQQKLPTSYGSYMQWSKDQIVAKDKDEKEKQQLLQKQQMQEEQDSQQEESEEIIASTTVETPSFETPGPAVGPQVIDLSNDIIKTDTTSSPAPPAPQDCQNKNEYCDYWHEKGECEKNPAYMRVNCPVACGTC